LFYNQITVFHPQIHSISVPEIQPTRFISNLRKVSNNLRVCRMMLEDLGERVDRHMDEIAQFVDRPLPDIKALRDEFIVEKLKQGVSERHLSQVLNMPLSAIRRSIAAVRGEPAEVDAVEGG